MADNSLDKVLISFEKVLAKCLEQGFPTGVHLDPRASTGLLEGPRLVTLIAYY